MVKLITQIEVSSIGSLSLYHFQACPYCMKTRQHIKKLGLDVEHRDIIDHPEYKNELLEGGHKTLVPCLRIERQGSQTLWLYESDDIIDFLNTYEKNMVST